MYGARRRHEPWHIPHIVEPHAAAPKLRDSDVARCFWLSASIPGSDGWLEGRGSPFTDFMQAPPKSQMPFTLLTMTKYD